MVLSLRQRLLGLGSLVILIFLLSTATALELAFREVAETARFERLQAQIYALLAAVDVDPSLILPEALQEARLLTPSSGLYAQIVDARKRVVWKSPSLLSRTFAADFTLQPGETATVRTYLDPGPKIFVLGYGVQWVTEAGQEFRFQVLIAEEEGGFRRQLQAYRRSLWGWLIGVTGVLMLVLLVVLKWSLRPLDLVVGALAEIEKGKSEAIRGAFPKELQGLVRNLNRLIQNDRSRVEHYRNTLANLAHSMKTPLSALRNSVENDDTHDRKTVSLEQIDQVNHMIEYQLAKASASGRPVFCEPIAIEPVVDRIIRALGKVYAEKGVKITVEYGEQSLFPGIEGDLMEMCGNLLENAFKWCEQEVVFRVRKREGKHEGESVLEIQVEDDGPGIPQDARNRVFMRGVRADQSRPGHGIGLAVVNDLVSAYHGKLAIEEGARKGARVCIVIPL